MSLTQFLSNSLNKLENIRTIRVYYLFLLPLLWIEYASSSARIRQVEKDILDKYLGSNYDTRIRPNGHPKSGKICGEEESDDGDEEDAPCRVDINMLVRSISRIDDVKMEYSTQLTFREHWHDDRLCYEEDLRRNNLTKTIKFLVLTEPERVWLPDLFFKNEKKGHFHKIIMPNVLLRVYPNGAITYSVRISLVLFCWMDLKYFPLDVQSCNITIASYGYQNKDLWLDWKPGLPNEVISLPKLYLPRFSLARHDTDRCDSITNTGNYSCINLMFKFKREFSYYLFLIYVPCCMLVIVSWVSFWIDPNSAAARVLLGVTSLLTMSRQISSINATLPPVSYIKAVDVWTECCLIFVFSALIEFAIVNYVSRADAAKAGHKRKRPAMNGARKKYDDSKDSGIESSDVEAGRNKSNKDQFNASMPRTVKKTEKAKSVHQRLYAWWVSRFTTRSKKIDVTSRVCFPLLFVIFNIFYWAKYMFRAELRDVQS